MSLSFFSLSHVNRSLSDINAILGFAKLDPSDLKPFVQCLYFSEQLENDSVRILEIEESVLETLQAGKRVTIRGSPFQNAVLVTESTTYDLKEAETSNSMLMIPQLSLGRDLPESGNQEIGIRKVTSVVHNYYELRVIKPRLKNMHELLKMSQYRGRECEGDEFEGKKFTLSELQNLVQASDQEILSGLAKINACEIQGYWRLLDFEYEATVLYHIIQLCEERDWLLEGVNMEECCQVLMDLFPKEIIEHVIQKHSDDEGDNSKSDVVRLSEDKICRHYAELCLRNSGKFNLNDFLRAWQESVPHGMKTNLAQIEGKALIDRDSRPEVIWYYSVENLPEDVSDRFEALFEQRKKWSLEEITPYIRDLTDDKTDAGALLTKYARASVQNGQKMFTSRKTL
ncbi:unnamed protein product [Candidula unifasciata]|uniref:Sister chromatid cohesion protein DCC1 n=1 Tax=Candidula unifasciata TaxID=100452 RepID=A0A8S3YHL0_9EUPU|nr:unnamed protein product [Candidula unifasciata]